MIYFRLFLIALGPVILSIILYFLENRFSNQIGKISYPVRQVAAGIIFGITACLGTEFGVDVGGAIANTRDAAILCGGLIFGGPAGIIAGVIGGIYRYAAVGWGAGAFTAIGCSVSCVIAGLYAAFLRKHLFDNKKPGWLMGLFAGLIMEAIHLNLIFITNISDIKQVVDILKTVTIPMMLCNGISVCLALLAVSLMGKQRIVEMNNRENTSITRSVQNWLLMVVLIAFVVTCSFIFILQTALSFDDVEDLLKVNISDVGMDIMDASDNNLLNVSKMVGREVDSLKEASNDSFKIIAQKYGVAEINLINEQGIITVSTFPDFVGYDMYSGDQSAEFADMMFGRTAFVQEFGPISYDETIYRKYSGIRLENGMYLQVGYDAEQFQASISEKAMLAAKNRHIGEGGSLIIADIDGIVISDAFRFEGYALSDIGFDIKDGSTQPETLFMSKIYNDNNFCMYDFVEGFYIIAVYSRNDALFNRDMGLLVNGFMEIIVFAVLFAVIYILIKNKVVNNIKKVNSKLDEITGGNLKVRVDVRDSLEFASLSDDINSTVETLKRYIKEAAERIDQELTYAKKIQKAALPKIEGEFIDNPLVDIFADMSPAKEVGGDFYDFYMVDDSHMAVTVADVSGKGIPAALFMMKAKTVLKNLIMAGEPIEEAMTKANEQMCENNESQMFITVWTAIVDIKTGMVEFSCAGHNPPVLKKKDGSFEYLKGKPGFVLAGLEGYRYKKQTFEMEKGDVLFLYTDGVTEATNSYEELFGEDRLLIGLQDLYSEEVDMATLCRQLRQRVDDFVAEAPQFDDITMVALKLKLGEKDENGNI